jgi:hypothetical protein
LTEPRNGQTLRVLFLRRWNGDSQVFAAFNFGDAQASLDLPLPNGNWRKLSESVRSQREKQRRQASTFFTWATTT